MAAWPFSCVIHVGFFVVHPENGMAVGSKCSFVVAVLLVRLLLHSILTALIN